MSAELDRLREKTRAAWAEWHRICERNEIASRARDRIAVGVFGACMAVLVGVAVVLIASMGR